MRYIGEDTNVRFQQEAELAEFLTEHNYAIAGKLAFTPAAQLALDAEIAARREQAEVLESEFNARRDAALIQAMRNQREQH